MARKFEEMTFDVLLSPLVHGRCYRVTGKSSQKGVNAAEKGVNAAEKGVNAAGKGVKCKLFLVLVLFTSSN